MIFRGVQELNIQNPKELFRPEQNATHEDNSTQLTIKDVLKVLLVNDGIANWVSGQNMDQ